MRLVRIAPILFLAGCGSSWQLDPDYGEIITDCATKLFYVDADDDGWGDPNSDPQPLCEPDFDLGLSASNGRDCDDDSPSITGRIGSICPDTLVTAEPGGPPIGFGGVVFAESEFVFVHGQDTPVSRYTMAESSCMGWSGLEQLEGDESWVPRGTLATFEAAADIQEVEQALEPLITGGNGVYAGFVGIAWEGDINAGAWSWLDGTLDDSITSQFTWCGGVEPHPTDFFPNLNPADPDHLTALQAQIPKVRLAMVRKLDADGGGWCLGLPWEAIPATVLAEFDAGTLDTADPGNLEFLRYSETEGHFICERPKPLPEDYEEFTSEDAGEDGGEEG